MIIKSLMTGPLAVNCYIIGDENSREAVCIDPGGNADDILAAINEDRLALKFIINTHGHFDHIGANGSLKKATGARLAIHKDDEELLANSASQGAVFGMDAASSPRPDLFLKDNDEIRIGSAALTVMHTPGHTRGGICLYLKTNKSDVLFTGDTLFEGSVGRTDLPGGSYEDLMSSIKNRILPLGDKVRIMPGHGNDSTIGAEKKSNPFLE